MTITTCESLSGLRLAENLESGIVQRHAMRCLFQCGFTPDVIFLKKASKALNPFGLVATFLKSPN
jgi:hypothetical protein